MGPQIVFSALFPGTLSVTYNVYRTYMRLLASLVTTVTSAAWPILNRWYAERRFLEIKQFIVRGLFVVSTACAGGSIILVLCARWIFHLLYHHQIAIILPWLSVVAISVFISTHVIVLQSLYLSTNTKSRSLPINMAITFAGLAMLYFAGRLGGFSVALVAQVFSEIAMLAGAALAVQGTLRRMVKQDGRVFVPR
jgi:O-antigen/teichoic acid export membrane protein